jgi:hypothetical protein
MKRHILFAAALMLSASTSVFAAQITDFNFDNLNIGDPLPTTAPSVDPQPQHIVYSTGGFQDDPTYTGTNVVGNAGTLSKAAIMTTAQSGTGSNFVDTQFLQNAETEIVSFDLDVLTTPTTGLPQSAPNAPNGQAWVMQAFETANPNNRAFRFVIAPTTATGGVFGLRNNTDGDIIPIFNYTNGDTHHIEIDANFVSATVNAFVDATQVASGLPFVEAPGNPDGLDELFIFQNGVEGVTNQVAFDNLVTTTVPEPTSFVLLGLGGITFGSAALAMRRRKS